MGSPNSSSDHTLRRSFLIQDVCAYFWNHKSFICYWQCLVRKATSQNPKTMVFRCQLSFCDSSKTLGLNSCSFNQPSRLHSQAQLSGLSVLTRLTWPTSLRRPANITFQSWNSNSSSFHSCCLSYYSELSLKTRWVCMPIKVLTWPDGSWVSC